MKNALYLALLAPLFFLVASPAVATGPVSMEPAATFAPDDTDPVEHPDCDSHRDDLDDAYDDLEDVNGRIADKVAERERYMDLLKRYEAAGAGSSPGANAMRGFVAELTSDLRDLAAERIAINASIESIWAWIVENCFI